MEWVTELEEAAMIVSISLCEEWRSGVEWSKKKTRERER